MRGFHQRWLIVASVVLVVAGTAWAQQSTNRRPVVRRYTGRIQLHEAPPDLIIPEEKNVPTDQDQPIPEEKGPYIPVIPGVSSLAMPYVPPTPAVSPGKEKKSENWILPPAPEDIEKKSESDPSGWGWLADEVKDRQVKVDREAQKKVEEEPALTGVLPSDSRKGDKGLIIDNTFKPVDSYELMRDMKRTDPQDMVADPRAAADRETARDVREAGLPATAYQPEKISEASRGAADERWGMDRVISQNRESQGGLLQTRSAMTESISLGRAVRPSAQQPRTSLSQFQTTSQSDWDGASGSSRSMFGNLSGVSPSFGSGASRATQPYSLSTDYDPFAMSRTKQSLSGEIKPLQPLQPAKPMGAFQPYDDSLPDDSGY